MRRVTVGIILLAWIAGAARGGALLKAIGTGANYGIDLVNRG